MKRLRKRCVLVGTTLDVYLTRFILVFKLKTKMRHRVSCRSMSHFSQNPHFQRNNAMYPYPRYLSNNAVFGRWAVVQFLFNIIGTGYPVWIGITELMKGIQSALIRCVFLHGLGSSGGCGCCSRCIEASMLAAAGQRGSFPENVLMRSARWRGFTIFGRRNPVSWSFEKPIQKRHDFRGDL